MPTAPTWPFVGRDQDQATLVGLLDDPQVTAIVITAPAGAGKTRLAREVVARTGRGLWCQASSAVTEVPHGAIADVLVPTAGDDHATVLDRFAAAIDDAGGLVVVDDAPHLDARTADLLRRVVDRGGVRVLATARTEVPVPAWMEWLWLGDTTRHHRLDPLDEAAVTRLVTDVLDPVDPATRAELVRSLTRRTAGNALFLRALLDDIVDRTDAGQPALADRALPHHLARVLEARLADAGPAVQGPLAAASVLGSVPLTVLRDRYGDAAAGPAEAAGYLTIDRSSRPVARPVHPLHAEVVLASLTDAERRSLTADVARAVLAAADALPSERVGATAALVTLGEPIDRSALVDAARTAFAALDHDLAVRLADAAIAAGDPFEAHVVLGGAHSAAGRPDRAEAALRDAVDAATTDDQRARAAGRLSVHLVAHGNRLDEADTVLTTAAASITDPAAAAFVRADRAKLATIRGDLTELAVVDESGDDLAVLNGAIVTAYAHAMQGDPVACRSTIGRSLPLADRHRTALPWTPDLLRFSGVFATIAADGPDAAATEAAVHLGDDDRTDGTWRFLTGFANALAGRLDAAIDGLARAADELDGHDLISARPLALATHAWALAQAGDLSGARDLLDGAVDAGDVDGRVRSIVAVADAWCDRWERGSTTTASAKLLAAADEAATGGQRLSAVIVLHELTRLGDPEAARHPLARLGRAAPSTLLVDVVTARAEAEATRDDAALAALCRRLTDRWPLVEAELAASRSRIASARDDTATAARAALDARRRARACGSTLPVTLRDLPMPLTDRELAVAEVVASGSTNREVAEADGVSIRTVENQLRSIYRKLGVATRTELAALLQADPHP